MRDISASVPAISTPTVPAPESAKLSWRRIASGPHWELGVLYRKEVERLGDEKAAVANVRKKFFNEICDASRDTRFFMGTVFPYNTWVVIGIFWPPKIRQESLFG